MLHFHKLLVIPGSHGASLSDFPDSAQSLVLNLTASSFWRKLSKCLIRKKLYLSWNMNSLLMVPLKFPWVNTIFCCELSVSAFLLLAAWCGCREARLARKFKSQSSVWYVSCPRSQITPAEHRGAPDSHHGGSLIKRRAWPALSNPSYLSPQD